MYCTECGAYHDNDSAFCSSCGAPLIASAPQCNMPDEACPTTPPSYADVPPSITVTARVKAQCSSVIALIATIAYTASIVMSFIEAIAGTAYLDLLFRFMTKLPGAEIQPEEEMVFGYLDMFIDWLPLIALIAMIPAIIIAIGMWITYASARKKKATMSTAGLNLIKIPVIMQFAGYALLFIAMLVVSIAVMIFEAPWIGLLIMAIMLIALILPVIYTCFSLTTLSSLTCTVKTGRISGKPSMFVAIMCFILAPTSFSSGLAGMCSATALVCIGIFIIIYRNEMKELAARGY